MSDAKIQGEGRVDIIQAITSPLGFFALSLLIVEGFLTIVLVFSDLDAQSKYYGMFIGSALFILVVIGVFLLVWFKPTNLTFGEKSHLQVLEMQKSWGTSDKPNTKAKTEESSEAVVPTITAEVTH